jgi:hypothetical protein
MQVLESGPRHCNRAAGKSTGLLRLSLVALLLPALAGCDEIAPPETPEPKPVEMSAKFDPANTGTISGRVTWEGALPNFAPITAQVPVPGGTTESRSLPNPNAPRIDPQTRGVAGAVVYLEQIEPRQGRPWDHPAVRVEMHANDIRILQGSTPRDVGFVRQGDEFEMMSREAVPQSLCVRGSAFFTLSFPDVDRPLRRRLGKCGLVELSSGMGRFWQQGYLFVCPHPYFTWTDDDGRFTLTQVPAGDLRVVCWLPNCQVARTERDPNTIGILRLVYEKPLERVIPIRLGAGDEKQAQFRMMQK